MTPLESFTRLASVGVSVEGLCFDPTFGPSGCFTSYGNLLVDAHATALLCNKVLERWPHWTCEQDGISGTWFVWDSDAACRRDDGNIGHADNYVCSHGKARTRLGAMVLAAEAKHKENSDAR